MWMIHEIIRQLLLDRKAMTNLDSVLNSRDITLPTKVHIVRLWSSHKHQRIDTFELWYWRFLRVPWTAWLREINPEYSSERLMLKLKLQYFGHLMQEPTHWKSPQWWQRLRAEEESVRGWNGWMASPMNMNFGKFQEMAGAGRPGVLQSMGSQSWTRLGNWTTTNKTQELNDNQDDTDWQLCNYLK